MLTNFPSILTVAAKEEQPVEAGPSWQGIGAPMASVNRRGHRRPVA